ncbi:MAG: YbaY family lipoprotein [Candidatus Promineofilum sp.]|nr:YbaY family lipoprotein [Promineifilum sp.]
MLSVVLMLVMALGLAACGGGQQGQETADVPAGSNVISGNVIYLDRSALDPNAVIEVELLQPAADGVDTVIASQSVNAEGRQVPIPFEIQFDAAQIDPTQTYLVAARIVANGAPVFVSQAGVPVITNGAPTQGIEVLVGPLMNGVAGGTLTGNVFYIERIALQPDALITVELQDVSAGTTNVIATRDINAEGRQVPIPFELPYDPTAIDPAGTYLLSARVSEGGQIVFSSPTGVPVLTNGAPTSNVELLVSQAAVSPMVDVIRGTVTTAQPPQALDPAAVLHVELREPMLADAPAASQIEIPMAGMTFPISFELPYDPGIVAADRTYTVAARVLSGDQMLYVTLSPVPVLTNSAPASEIIVPVAPVPDPAGGVLRYTVTSDTPMTWPADSPAYLNVEIREPMLADAPATAFSYVPLAGLSFPVAFELGYDPATIDPNKAYIFDARIIDNNLLTFSSSGGTPVLTQGAPVTDVALNLVASTVTDAPPSGAITGVVTTDAPTPLDPGATLYVDFREAGTTGDPIVTISKTLEGAQFPIAFEVPLAAATLDPTRSYVVGARILLGDQVLYASAVGVPVVTQGAPTTDVTVNIPPQ